MYKPGDLVGARNNFYSTYCLFLSKIILLELQIENLLADLFSPSCHGTKKYAVGSRSSVSKL